MTFSRVFLVVFFATIPLLSGIPGRCFGQTIPPTKSEPASAHAGLVTVEAELQNPDPFQPEGTEKTIKWAPGQRLDLVIRVNPSPGWHGYPFSIRTSTQEVDYLSRVKFEPSQKILAGGAVVETEPVQKLEPVDQSLLMEHEGAFFARIPIILAADLPKGPFSLKALVKLQVCQSQCVWGDHLFQWDGEISGTPLGLPQPPPQVWAMPITVREVAGGTGKATGNAKGQPGNETPTGKPRRESVASTRVPQLPEESSFEIIGLYDEGKINKPESFVSFLTTPTKAETAPQGFLAFLLQGVFWGAISLVTPCVFPMIPVTVSFFLKQENNRYSPFFLALVYCGTIILVLSLAAFAFLSVFVWLSTNTLFNAAMGLLFIYFSLSLLGMYDIELPSFLTQFTSSRESQGGVSGTIFMALTFTMLSFACVAPFLGGFGGVAIQSGMPWWQRLLGGVAFSATFASPFFLLALFPGWLKSLPKSGGWLNTVKVTMGFLELAAAVKFFRLAEIKAGEPVLFTYDFSMALTIGVLFACSAYLFGWFRLPLDTPEDYLSVPRAAIATALFALALHLIPAMWSPSQGGQAMGRVRPQGVIFSWLDAFLLPDEVPLGSGEGALEFSGDLALALEASKKDGKPVFVDFTGVTCTNCKWNESNVFPLPQVRQGFEKYHLVQLFTDRVPAKYFPEGALSQKPGLDTETADENRAFQSKAFQTAQLPLYAILKPK